MLNNKEEAYQLLSSLGAPKALLLHVQLVGEAADILLSECAKLQVPLDQQLVEVGVAIHDAGKILHSNELKEKGGEHEPAGERLMLSNGASVEQARCCLSHARYQEMFVSLEELLIALADKLWKGKRVEELELRVIDKIAKTLDKTRWDIFEQLDNCFESIAADGLERLARSRV
ncbi:HD domain-containing protein [Pleionea sp. CnH1-48]|uniref:HD domain-containing protein n=1 Tax=Pleionea sp. CnH1-48 TaxID=2954494 RepID=UPI0020983D4E|nr:HD domain-containing protein [Pleionea sp. CnH1-48]MCO7225954.1 HD domain-containing protein [Pleionea sp. CnH1-48]